MDTEEKIIAGILIASALLVIGLIGAFGFIVYQATPWGCSTRGKNYDLETKWTWSNGCMLKMTDGAWIDEDKYRGITD